MGILEDRLKAAQERKAAEFASKESESVIKNSLNEKISDISQKKQRVDSAREFVGTLQEMLVTKEESDAEKALNSVNTVVDAGLLELRSFGEEVSPEEEQAMRQEKTVPILEKKQESLDTINTGIFSDIVMAGERVGADLDSESEFVKKALVDFSEMNNEDRNRLADTLKTGGLDALKKFYAERQENKNKELLQITLPESGIHIEIPDSKYSKLFAYGFRLRKAQKEYRDLNEQGNKMVKLMRDIGTPMEDIKNDSKIREIASKIRVVADSVKALKDQYLGEEKRLQEESLENAPKNENELRVQVEGLRKKVVALDFGPEADFVIGFVKQMKDLRNKYPEYALRNNAEYNALSQDSSGKNNTKIEKIANDLSVSFANFVVEEFRKDSQKLESLEKFGKIMKDHRFAVMDLSWQHKELINYVLTSSPNFLPWIKNQNRDFHQKMWNLVRNDSSFVSWDLSYDDFAMEVLAKKFGAIDKEDFEPLR